MFSTNKRSTTNTWPVSPVLVFIFIRLLCDVASVPVALLYDHNPADAARLPQGDDISSHEIPLKVPIKYFGTQYDTIFVNNNGLVSFNTELPSFFNVEFPLDYPLVAAFYSNVDTTNAGTVTYFETSDPDVLERASDTIRESFSDQSDFQADSVFLTTWFGVGYYDRGQDRINTYQLAFISSKSGLTFVELLYPDNGIQWIQGTGDESGLPDARAQAGFISHDHKVFSLPGSGTEQVRNLERWSNINLPGQFVYRVDQSDIIKPDFMGNENSIESGVVLSCAQAPPTQCHIQAKCTDYEDGFCCHCNSEYYGNGRSCVKKDVPLRVNGKVNGRINSERLDDLDLQSYIVMTDGRAYTAISRIPYSIGFGVQTLQILGGVIGYVFAKPVRDASNGYQLTGGVFNYTATVRYLNTSQQVVLKQKFTGLDVFDQLRLEVEINGEIPELPQDAKVIMEEYKEQYTLTAPGVIQMSAVRPYRFTDAREQEITHWLSIEQVFLFDYCKFDNQTAGQTWRLHVGRNFISYETREQIIRFGLTNKVAPLGDVDPCEEGRRNCGQHSVCIVEDDNFRCICVPGFQQMYNGSATVCMDIDECQRGLHDCDVNAHCLNEPGTFQCRCNAGFDGDGRHCQVSQTCGHSRCHSHAECIELDQVAQCRCLPGFTGDGEFCDHMPTPQPSCRVLDNCREFSRCSLVKETGDYACLCLPGYEGDGDTCVRIEHPASTTEEPKLVIQRCILGVCWCPEGYRLLPKSKYCTPANTSDADTSSADDDAKQEICELCTQTEDCVFTNAQIYECVCQDGYARDSQNQCVESTSCGGGSSCVENAECLYDTEFQVRYCSCKTGYIGDGITECKLKPIGCNVLNNCGLHATCQYDQTSAFYQCRCEQGFYGDGFVCYTEINCHVEPSMCSTNALCVTDADRRYVCECQHGYVGNGTICTPAPKHEGNFLLLNQGMATLRVPFEPSKTNRGKPIQVKHYQTAVGLDIDCLEGRVYWSDISGMAIRSALYNGSSKMDFLVQGIGSPEGLAIDWVSRNIYWTDSTKDTIEVAGIDSRRRRVLFDRYLVNPRGIAVHPQRGKIFWSDWDRSRPKIEWANADGSGREIYLQGPDVALPNSLTIDYDTEQLCYADAGTKNIECVDIDSRQKTTIAVNCTYPFGIAVTDKYIYWSDWVSKKIERVDKFSLNRLQPLELPLGGSGNKLFGLVAVPQSCPALTNVCQYSKEHCPSQHICLPDGHGSRRCLCATNSIDPTESLDCEL